MIDKTNYKQHLRFFLVCVLCILGAIGGLGSLNYCITGGGIYFIAGFAVFGTAIYTVAQEYKRFNNNT